MINAPPPSASWGPSGAGRFSLDSAADRLSEDLSRMSFEAQQQRWAGGARGLRAPCVATCGSEPPPQLACMVLGR